MDTFRIVQKTLPQPDAPTVVANGGDYTNAMVNMGYQTVHDNVHNQICMAFLINFLPGELRSKLLEKKPTTIKECLDEAVEYQRFLKDKNWPMGTPPSQMCLPSSMTPNWKT